MMKAYFAGVPVFFRPFWMVYGFLAAVIILTYFRICTFTCKLRIEGVEFLTMYPAVIRAQWHQTFMGSMLFRASYRRDVWINHPLTYMIPWYFIAKMVGIHRMIPGSTGHSGREAAEALVEELKRGTVSTNITPDGPGGPSRVLKKGVLHIAEQSGLPILPIRITMTNGLVTPSWDQKILPLPFVTSVLIQFQKPIFVTADNRTEMEAHIQHALG